MIFCISCLSELNYLDDDPNGEHNAVCAKCRAEENHDFDTEPDVLFLRNGKRLNITQNQSNNMSDIKLGELPDNNAKRDAIHVAIIPVYAGQDLQPGQHVGKGANGTFVVCPIKKCIGIVDPFLTQRVMKGERFYLCLYQKTVIGMRHVWKHPDFAEETNDTPEQERSREWIKSFAESVGITFDVLMDGARDYVRHGNYLCLGRLLEGVSVPDAFWDHYEVLTGTRSEGGFFTCSC